MNHISSPSDWDIGGIAPVPDEFVLKVPVVIDVMVRRLGETWFASKVTELGIGVFELASLGAVQPGDRIWVRFPGFDGRPARVDWCTGQKSGCAFESPLHLGVFDHLLRYDISRL